MSLFFEDIEKGRKEFLKVNLEKIPLNEFHEWALIQKDLFPDMLYFNTEEEIIEMFYKAFKRKRQK